MDKDTMGRFLPGNKCQASRIKRDGRAKWDSVMKPQQIKLLAQKLLSMALNGNLKAAIYCLDRSLGKMKETIELQQPPPPVNLEEQRIAFRAMLTKNYGFPPSAIN